MVILVHNVTEIRGLLSGCCQEGHLVFTVEKARITFYVLASFGLTVWLSQFMWELLANFGTVLLIFILAWMISLALLPIVRFLRRFNIPNTIASIFVYLTIIGLLTLLGLIGGPIVVDDLSRLAIKIADYRVDLELFTREGLVWVHDLGISQHAVDQFIQSSSTDVAEVATVAATELLNALTGVAKGIFVFLAVVVVSFYVVVTFDRSIDRFCSALPEGWGERVKEGVFTVERTFAAYLSGLLAEVIIFGIATAIAMLLAGAPFIAVTATVSALFLLIPWIGAVIGITLPVLVASLDSWTSALWIGLALILVELFIEHIVRPNLVGQAVGVNPLVIIASILIGTTAVGFWGAVFSVPFGALIYISARTAFLRWSALRKKADAAGSGLKQRPYAT